MSSFLVLCEGDAMNRWRDGQVCPDVGQGTMAPWARRLGCVFGVLCANRTREVKRDFCDGPIRRDEGRVVNTPLVFKRVLFQERGEKKKERRGRRKKEKEGDGKEKKKSRGERGARLVWRKGLVRDWVESR
ncbi:hypothetical protein TNCV_154421 [Trichonephila clavipes]|uniref:Uncharacterized protein n=1 Tax=Trichonephila clavipes TaxID=2585209 RepID=A0A8X6WH67_TRICX|nr:hypothetical protein TNCV_154421 [Trichonephila clavipes]